MDNKVCEKDKMERFIEFVVDLVQEDDFFYETGLRADDYFLNGGCYELYKIVNHYFPTTKCMVRNDNEHCAVGYEGNVYDATGKLENKDEFRLASEDDIKYMSDNFGTITKLYQLCADKIISDIEECNIKGML